MTDLSSVFATLLEPHNVHLAPSTFHPSKLRDDFLKESYTINAHISHFRTHVLSIRSSYLSTAPQPSYHHHNHRSKPSSSSPSTPTPHQPLTTSDRDAFDASSKTLLRDIHASITQLSTAETLRHEAALNAQKHKKGKFLGGRLGRWAAGGDPTAQQQEDEGGAEGQNGEEETLKRWREGVLWFLRKRLEEVGRIQRGMMERRVEREVERGKSSLYGGGSGSVSAGGRGLNGSLGGSAAASSSKGRYARREINDFNPTKSPQNNTIPPNELASTSPSPSSSSSQQPQSQIQILEAENASLLTHCTTSLTALSTAERSLQEISSLQSQLVSNLDVQSAQIEQLVTDGLSTAENVGGGNKELKRASERRSVARGVFWGTVGLCVGLVGWDLIF